MKVTAKGRYGLRAMLDLASSHGGSPVLMSRIAANQGLSRKHLHAMLTTLKEAGLVLSVRGPGGGFVLSRPPGQIRISEILSSLEGPIALMDCVADKGHCLESDACAVRGVWVQLAEAIDSALSGVTLADLVRPTGGTCVQETESGEGCGTCAGSRCQGEPPSAASRNDTNKVGAW